MFTLKILVAGLYWTLETARLTYADYRTAYAVSRMYINSGNAVCGVIIVNNATGEEHRVW